MKVITTILISCLLIVSAGDTVFGQNDVQFTHFMFNKLNYNPAHAGGDEALHMQAIYRDQWFKIEGAPSTLNVQVHTPFAKNRCGIGLSLTHDKIGFTSTTSAALSYAYRMPVGKNTLSFGLNGRVDYGLIDWTQAQGNDQNDGLIGNAEETQQYAPNFGAGVMFGGDRFYVGFSIPQMLNNANYLTSNISDARDFKMKTMYLMGGATFPLSSKVKFQPSILASANASAPFDLDVNAGFVFLDALYLGATFRLEDSWDLLAMYQITKQLRLGAAYDFTVSELSDKTSGSIECLVQYNFQFDKTNIRNIRFF